MRMETVDMGYLSSFTTIVVSRHATHKPFISDRSVPVNKFNYRQ
jgi:hypothetical protein